MISMSLSTVALADMALIAGTDQAVSLDGVANGGVERVGGSTPADRWLQAASACARSNDAHAGSFPDPLALPAFDAAVVP